MKYLAWLIGAAAVLGLLAFQNCAETRHTTVPEGFTAKGNGDSYSGKVYRHHLSSGFCPDGSDVSAEIVGANAKLFFIVREDCANSSPRALTSDEITIVTPAGLVYQGREFASEIPDPGATPIPAPQPTPTPAPLSRGAASKVFTSTGADQIFVVPAGVSTLKVAVWGAGGGGSRFASRGGYGGAGGFVSGDIPVTPGEFLTIVVGKGGEVGTAAVLGVGAYGGGGACGQQYGGGGGGRSAVRRSGVELVTAGGGGGSASDADATSGNGGAGGVKAAAGQDGVASDGSNGTRGFGGTRTAGGMGGLPAGRAGSQLQGASVDTSWAYGDGGGGGGGYYGGGSGGGDGSGGQAGGGGGGSSYAAPGIGGLIFFADGSGPKPYTGDAYVAGVAVGAPGASLGGPGLIVISY